MRRCDSVGCSQQIKPPSNSSLTLQSLLSSGGNVSKNTFKNHVIRTSNEQSLTIFQSIAETSLSLEKTFPQAYKSSFRHHYIFYYLFSNLHQIALSICLQHRSGI